MCVFYDIFLTLENVHTEQKCTAIFFSMNAGISKTPDFSANVNHVCSWYCDEYMCAPLRYLTGKMKQICKVKERRNKRDRQKS